MIGTPEFITGFPIIISGPIVSALGIRLNILSIENGQISLIATIPHKSTVIHLGAFFSNNLKSNTASTSQLADILIFTTFKKNSLILTLLS